MFPSACVRRCLFVAPLLVAPLAFLIAQEPAKGKKYALIVGVRSYKHQKLADLKYTENDAEALAQALPGFAEVVVLTTSRGAKNKADTPTAANIRKHLDRLLRDVGKRDTILVALSGHGVQLKGKDAAGKLREEGFFCPADAKPRDDATLAELSETMIGFSELFRKLDDSGVGVKLLLVDACRNDPKASRSVTADAMPRPARGMAALFSCKTGERAFETDRLGKGHGVFFYHVLRGLRGEAKNKRGEITWSSLVDHVIDKVADDVPTLIGGGAKQTPEEIRKLEGKSPVLVESDRTAVVRQGWPKEITNSIAMKLVRIPPGTFTMGSPRDEKDRSGDEKQHEVEITREFWLGVHEVTQGQFKAVMGYNPSFFSKSSTGREGVKYHFSPLAGGKDKVPDDTSAFPVENVSWNEAVEFCEKLTARAKEKAAGRQYRLPSEAEWEYACRGGASSYQVFHFGDSLSSTQANFDSQQGRTTKVGSYKANAFGLFDMHGNVWEWCADWYGRDYYGKSPRRDPPGPLEGSYRVGRGGGWGGPDRRCRSAHRLGGAPSLRSYRLGFRVALVPSGSR